MSLPAPLHTKKGRTEIPQKRVRPILGVLAALAAYDFIAPDLLYEGSAIEGFLIGLLFGQPLLLAVWAVLGPWAFWRRWLASLATGICLYAIFLAGMAIADASGVERQLFAVNLLFLPLVLLCAQFPLWVLRLTLGRRLAHEDESLQDEERGIQFRTQDALTAIGLIGLSLGLARIAVLLHNVEGNGESMGPWLGLAVACGVAGLSSALVLLPCVWAAFLTDFRGVASLAILGYAVVLVACVSMALAFAFDVVLLSDILTMLLALHAGLLTVVLLGCQKIRSWGYTLQRAP